MPKTLDRAALHALLDVVIDEAEKDLGAADGSGLSLQGAHGPYASIMFVAGEHSEYSPQQVVKMSLKAFDIFCRVQGTRIENRRGVSSNEMQDRMEKNLAPKPPSKN
jgi:hypothetical protein